MLDCSNLLRYIRAVKTDDEIERLRRAAQINEAAATASLAEAAPGVSLAQLSRSYRAQVAQDGADFDHFALGIDGVGIATEPAHQLADGAVMYVDFGCRWRSCYSDSGLTLALGPLPQNCNAVTTRCAPASTRAWHYCFLANVPRRRMAPCSA